MGRPSLDSFAVGPSRAATAEGWNEVYDDAYPGEMPLRPETGSSYSYSPSSASGMAHWTCIPSEVHPKPRSKGQLGRGSLRHKLPENYYLTDVVRSGSTPSTRASTAQAAADSNVPTPGSSRRIWRRPPATFRRRHHVGKVYANKTTASPAGDEGTDAASGGPRAWSTEPSSSGAAAGRLPPFQGSSDLDDTLPESGKRPVTVLGLRRELAPYSEDDAASARAESRAEPSKFARFMAEQGRYVTDYEEAPAPSPMAVRPLPALADSSQDAAAASHIESSLRSDLPATSKAEESRLTSRSGYNPEVMERLARPHEPGASERTKRRAMSRAYEAFAQQVATNMVPGAGPSERSCASALAYGDRWHTAGEDGYRSALFHAAVRCRQLQQGSGLDEDQLPLPEVRHGPDGPELVFQGNPVADALEGIIHSPELVRLHTACFVFEEICKVSSPLQDTLRFLFREMCFCIFQGFRPGQDILVLLPFFVSALQAQTEAEEQRRRAEAAEMEAHSLRLGTAELTEELARIRVEFQALREREQAEKTAIETLNTEKNQLRVEVTRLQTLNEIRADELRSMGKELSHTQGNASDLLRELELSKKSFIAITGVSKEQKNNLERLQGQVADLQLALRLASDPEAREEIPDKPHDMQATPPSFVTQTEEQLADVRELSQELAIRMQRASPTPGDALGWAGRQHKVADHGRLLKIPRHDGGYQVVMRGSVEEEHGNVGVRGSASSGGSPVLIVSGDTFTALAIGLALPQPPDPVLFKVHPGNDDDEIVREVYREVQALAQERSALLALSRGLRRDLKESLMLAKEWNRDEIRGVLQNVLVLDSEEVTMVPSPVVGSQALVGLGEDDRVPQFLRYDGVLKVKNMEKTEVERICQAIWLAKTQKDVDQLNAGASRSSLTEYLAEVYVPSVASRKVAQMEHTYNLFLAIRQSTTISSFDALEKQYQEDMIKAQKEGPPATSRRRLAGSQSKGRTSGHVSASVFASTPGGLAPEGPSEENQQEAMLSVPSQPTTPTRPRSGRRSSGLPTLTLSSPINVPNESEDGHLLPAGHGASAKQLQAAVPRLKVRLTPDISFHASSEILYRSLMSELHEDVHHDQTSMLLALCHAFAALSEHLAPAHWNAPAGVPREIEPAVIGLAEMSAILRLFFPGKPREHLSEIKRCVLSHIAKADASKQEEERKVAESEAEARRNAATSPGNMKRRPGVRDSLVTEEKKTEPKSEKEPPVVDVGTLMGVRMWRGQVVINNPDDLLVALIQDPTPFVLELRRQHVIECLMFVDRLQKAFRASTAGAGGPASDTGVPLATVKQVEATLISVDPGLTEDQRRVYILRGFGRRLPDPPSIDGAADELSTSRSSALASSRGSCGKREKKRAQFEDCTHRDMYERAARRAAVMYKTRYLLKDHVNQLADDNAMVPMDVFVKRLASLGVTKGGRMWSPDITTPQVIEAAGLPQVRATTASGCLEELLDNSGLDNRDSADGGRHENADFAEVSKFQTHVTAGKDIQELSAGYPELILLHWLASPT